MHIDRSGGDIMTRISVVGLLSMTMMNACSTAAEKQINAIVNQIALAQQATSACYAGISNDPVMIRVGEYMLSRNDDPRKMEKLSDQRALPPEVHQDILGSYRLIANCEKVELDALGRAHPAYRDLLTARNDAKEMVIVGLLNGVISIGQANQDLIYIDDLAMRAWTETNRAIGQQLAQADAQERQRWAATAMALQQYSYQQQQLQLQRQQQMNDALNRQLNTNCQIYGNQINCYSF
jgi:hypothetical protein